MKHNLIWSKMLPAIALMWNISSASAAQMVLQKGHGGQMTRVALSASGAFLASSALDDPIKIWRPRTGEFIRDLPDSRDELPLAWSPDGKILLSAARDQNYASPRALPSIRVRSMPTGRVIRTLRGLSAPLWFDGRIIRTTDGESVSDWRVSNGAKVASHRLAKPRAAQARAANLVFDGQAPRAKLVEGSLEDGALDRFYAFSRNGRWLAFGGTFDKNRASVWDARTGRLQSSVGADKKAFGLPAVSDDGRFLVTQGEDPQWNPPGPGDYGGEAAFARTFQLHLWNLGSRRIVASWPGYGSLSGGVTFLRFARDGRRVFCGGDDSGQIRAVPSGKLIRQMEAHRYHDVSGDDRLWAWGTVNDEQVLSIPTGKPISTMPKLLSGGHSLLWSPDGRFLAFGSDLGVWDVREARLLQTSATQWRYYNRARWMDATTLQTENLQSVMFWKMDAKNGHFTLEKRIEPNFAKTPNNSREYTDSVFLSPDARQMLTNSNDFRERGTLYLWDETGKTLVRKILVRKSEESISSLDPLWLPDSTRFLVATIRGIEIWNAETGARQRTLDAPASWPRPTQSYQDLLMFPTGISPDGQFLAVQSAIYSDGKSGGSGVWNIASGQMIRATPGGIASWSPDNLQLALDSTLWNDWQTADKPRLTLPANATMGAMSREAALAWSPDGERIAVGAEDALYIFRSSDGRELGQLTVGTDSRGAGTGDWLARNRDGFFNAPDKGQQRVRWMENGVLLPLNSPRDRVLRAKFFQAGRVGNGVLGR